MQRPLIVTLIGWSESGKTGLIVAALEECRRRGIQAAAAKCTRHGGDFEPAGKDSARYRAAGASPVAFIGTGAGGLTVTFAPSPPEPDRAYLERLFPDSSLVFSEGLEVEGAIRVLVDKEGEELKRPLDWAEVLVTANPERAAQARENGILAIPPLGGAALVDYVEVCMDRDVTVTCGGKDVPLNDFAKEIVGNTLAGLVSSLKKTDVSEEIVVRIGKKK